MERELSTLINAAISLSDSKSGISECVFLEKERTVEGIWYFSLEIKNYEKSVIVKDDVQLRAPTVDHIECAKEMCRTRFLIHLIEAGISQAMKTKP